MREMVPPVLATHASPPNRSDSVLLSLRGEHGADLDGDGTTSGADLGILLSEWTG